MQSFINKTMMKILVYCISSAFKIDCIYLIFLQVFDVSCFDLGGRSNPPPLDPPQNIMKGQRNTRAKFHNWVLKSILNISQYLWKRSVKRRGNYKT